MNEDLPDGVKSKEYSSLIFLGVLYPHSYG